MHMNLTRVGICVVVGFFLSWICTSKFFIDTPEIILDAEDVDLGGSGSSSNEKGTRGIGPQLVRHVWSKMMDFDSYRKWSPYLYSIRPSTAASTKASSSTSTKSLSTSVLQKNTPLIFLFVVSDQQDKEKEIDRKVNKDKGKDKEKDKKKSNKLFIERYGKIFHIDEGNSTKKKICWSYDNLWAKSYMMSEIECYQVELLPFDYIEERKNEKEKRKEREKNANAEEDETVITGEADVGLDEEFEGGEPPPHHHHHNKDNKQSKKKARVRVRVRLWKWFSGPFSTVYSLLYHESISERMHLFAKELKKYLSA